MPTDSTLPRFNVVQVFSDIWNKWQKRRARLVEFDHFDPAEMQRVARDLGVPVSELRILTGHDEHAADLLQRRLRTLHIDAATVEPAVMRDLQRCCSQCRDKSLCAHEIEDQPKGASWPKYCPNEQTIDALVAEKTV